MLPNLNLQLLLGQRGNLLIKQLLRPHPHGGLLSILQAPKTRQQRIAKRLGRLTRQQRGEVIDGNDRQRRPRRRLDGNGGLVKRRVDVVDGDGVVGVGRVARDVADDAEGALVRV